MKILSICIEKYSKYICKYIGYVLQIFLRHMCEIYIFFYYRQGRSLDRQITTQDIDCLRVRGRIMMRITRL